MSGVTIKNETRFHINEILSSNNHSEMDRNKTIDRICALAISEKLILIGRDSGVMLECSIPDIKLNNLHQTVNQIDRISINCNST